MRIFIYLQWLAKHLGINQFLPSNKLLKYLSYECELLNVNKEICEDIIFVLCGFDKAEFNTVMWCQYSKNVVLIQVLQTLLPIVLGHIPAGTSTKTVIHYAQEIHHDGKFQVSNIILHFSQVIKNRNQTLIIWLRKISSNNKVARTLNITNNFLLYQISSNLIMAQTATWFSMALQHLPSTSWRKSEYHFIWCTPTMIG